MTDPCLGLLLYLGYFGAAALLALAVKALLAPPFEAMRKALHLVMTLSDFPLVHLFDTWHMAVVATGRLVLIGYPALALIGIVSAFALVASLGA